LILCLVEGPEEDAEEEEEEEEEEDFVFLVEEDDGEGAGMGDFRLDDTEEGGGGVRGEVFE
jgi:hypothetical protein